MRNNVPEGLKEAQSYANTRTTGKEQYYTKKEVVDLCIEEVLKHVDLKDKKILEPCGGTGEFIEGLLRVGVDAESIISYDIEPHHELVKSGDYLEKEFEETNLISITNPPFGRASQLAKKFFNHAADHSKYICYLVPRSWRKWSTINSLDENFHLIADIDLPKDCFYLPENKTNEKGVLSTVFQIWERREEKRKKIKVPDHKLIKKIQPSKKTVTSHRKVDKVLYERAEDGSFVEVTDEFFNKVKVKRPNKVKGANFQIIVFGHGCGKCKEITEPEVEAKTTTMYLQVEREDVKEALKSVNFSKFCKNVAYVEALSIQEINYCLNEHFGLPNFEF